ncbi:hypothetical protein EIP86_009983, partial [Pleurotus ostreatoroseus]
MSVTVRDTRYARNSREPADPSLNALWGTLTSLKDDHTGTITLDLLKIKQVYSFGSNKKRNDFTISGPHIKDSWHCTMWWNRQEGDGYKVSLMNWSRSGIFVDGVRLNGDDIAELKNDSILSFGKECPDYFIFHNALTALSSTYRFISLVGEGGFGKVWKVQDRRTLGVYACKVICVRSLGQTAVEDSESNTYLREVSVLEKIEHPNVCRIKEWFFEGYKLSIVMEWVSGGDLLLKREPTARLPMKAALHHPWLRDINITQGKKDRSQHIQRERQKQEFRKQELQQHQRA